MLILEAKVREGVKPVVTIDSKANGHKLGDATWALISDVYQQLQRKDEEEAERYMRLLSAIFWHCVET